ncbi:MAG: hypothetical protein GF331_07000 [Chitinivibrionales bacterium]|nr:hypothetical protein [Chitinivibrionales bacterium]
MKRPFRISLWAALAVWLALSCADDNEPSPIAVGSGIDTLHCVAVTALTDSAVVLYLGDTTGPDTCYVVLRDAAPVRAVCANDTFTDTTVGPDTYYRYRIALVADTDTLAQSAFIDVRTPSAEPQPAGSLTVSVTLADHTTHDSVMVAVSAPFVPPETLFTDADGGVCFPALTPSAYAITVSRPGYTTAAAIVDVRDDSLSTVTLPELLRFPVACAGNDTVVERGTDITLTAGASSDSLGEIALFEWDIGASGTFVPVSGGDTSVTVHASAVVCVLRVTDDDGLTDLDTVLIATGLSFACATEDGWHSSGGTFEYKGTAFADHLWLFRGLSPLCSSDGVEWMHMDESSGIHSRTDHALTTYGERMWLIGGTLESYISSSRLSDVWYTFDGRLWNKLETDGVLPPVSGHQALEHDGYLWVVHVTGAYRTQDGSSWRRVSDTLGFIGDGFRAVSFAGRMWVVGGMTASANMPPSVWYSDDGSEWTAVVDSTRLTHRRGHGLVVYDGLLWMIGGRENGTYVALNDIVCSMDGHRWTKTSDTTAFSPRYDLVCAVKDERIWVVGGTGSSASSLQDVWYSQLPSDTP